jgi:hypothetical protein
MTDCECRPHIEDAYLLSVSDLLAAHARGSWSVPLRFPQPAGGQEAVFTLRLGEAGGLVDLTYAAGHQGQLTPESDTIALEATRPNYGGIRWWFRCSITGKRASKLYLFPGQRRFCHRTGIDPNPTYLSQRVAGMDKVLRRMYALRQSIPGQSGSTLDTLKLPPGMHLKTYVKLLRRDAAIWNSRDNKLLALLNSLPQGDL